MAKHPLRETDRNRRRKQQEQSVEEKKAQAIQEELEKALPHFIQRGGKLDYVISFDEKGNGSIRPFDKFNKEQLYVCMAITLGMIQDDLDYQEKIPKKEQMERSLRTCLVNAIHYLKLRGSMYNNEVYREAKILMAEENERAAKGKIILLKK